MKVIILLALTLTALSVDGARLRRQLEREDTVDPVAVPAKDTTDNDEDLRPLMTDVVIVDKNGDGSMTDTRYDMVPETPSKPAAAAAAAAGPGKKQSDAELKPALKPEELDISVDEDDGKFSVSGHMPEVEHFHGSMSDIMQLMSRRFDDMFRRVAVAFGSPGSSSSEEDDGPILVRIPIGGGDDEGDLEGAHSGGSSSESDDGHESHEGHQPGGGCEPCAHLFGAAGHGIHRMPQSPFAGGHPLFGARPMFGNRPIFGGRPMFGARPMLGDGQGLSPFGPGGFMTGLEGFGSDDEALPTNYNNTKTELVTMHGKQFLKKTKTIRKGSPGAQIHITSVSYVPVDDAENEEPGSVADDLPPIGRRPGSPSSLPPVVPSVNDESPSKDPLAPKEPQSSPQIPAEREIEADLPPASYPSSSSMSSDDIRKPTAEKSDIPPPA